MLSSSASTSSTLVDDSASELIDQLKFTLEGIVADRHEYQRKCQDSSLRDVKEAMKGLKEAVPKDRGELSRKLASCAASLDAIAVIVGPLFQAGQPVAPIVFASITAILKLCINREKVIQAIADTFLIIANTLPHISRLSSIEPYNRAVTQIFSGMVRFLVDAAKFLRRNKFVQATASFFGTSNLEDAYARLKNDLDITHFLTTVTTVLWQKKRDILLRINHVPYEEDLEARRKARFENTCSWSLAHPLIAEWLYGATDKLWIHGSPGTGKSVLAAYLIDFVQEQINKSTATKSSSFDSEVLLYFFCDGRSAASLKRSSNSIALTLLTQLVNNPKLQLENFPVFMDYVTSASMSYNFPLEKLMGHLMAMLRTFSKVWIIIDALDECNDEVVEPNGIIQLLQTESRGVNLKLACLSRRERTIKDRLGDWCPVEVGGEDTMQNDLHRFASAKAYELKLEYRYPGDPTKLANYMVHAAGNMFLYIVLKFENLKLLSPAHMKNEIERSPEELDDLYAQYLDRRMKQNQDPDNKLAIWALQWIVYSRQPITSLLLDATVALTGHQLNETRHIPDVRKPLEGVLGILVEFRKASDRWQATLVHQTLKDFLVRSGDNNKTTLLRVADPSRILLRLRNPLHETRLRDNLSTVRKPIQETELYVLCDPLRSGESHLRLLEACVVGLSSHKFLVPFQRYNDSLDRRRTELSKKQRHKRLESELCDCNQWGHLKELRRLLELDDARRRRQEEMADIREHLRTNFRNAVGQLEDAKLRRQERLKQLEEWEKAGWRREREEADDLHELTPLGLNDLLSYAFGNVSSHIGETLRHRDNIWNPAEHLISLLDMYLDRVTIFASSVAANTKSQLQAPTSRPSAKDSSHIATLNFALRSLNLTVSNIKWLSQVSSGESQLLGDAALAYHYWRWSMFPRFSNTTTNPTSILHKKILISLDDIEAMSEQRRLKYLLGLATQALISLRRSEVALYTIDEEWQAIIGASNLIDASQRAAQTFVRYAVYRICVRLPAQHELVTIFDKDDFMSSILLQPLPRPSAGNHWGNMRQALVQHWVDYPLTLAVLAVVFFTAGVMNWILVWIPVLFALSCSGGRLYNCQSSDPSNVHEISHILTPSFLIGRLFFLRYRVAVPSALTFPIIVFYTAVLLYFAFHSCGPWSAGVHRIWPGQILSYTTAVMSWSCVFTLLWHGVVSALLQDMSVSAVLNVVTAHIFSLNMVTIAMDRTGLRRAYAQLGQISACPEHLPYPSGKTEISVRIEPSDEQSIKCTLKDEMSGS